MTRLLTFQQTGNLIEYSAPMGIGGEFPETTNARLADFALRHIDNESLDLRYLDTGRVSDFSDWFMHNTSLHIDLSAWDVSSGTDFGGMFLSSAVTELDLSGWVLPSGATKDHMLNTASLQNLYCKNETEADKLTTETQIRTGVKVWVGKRGAPGTYLYKTT